LLDHAPQALDVLRHALEDAPPILRLEFGSAKGFGVKEQAGQGGLELMGHAGQKKLARAPELLLAQVSQGDKGAAAQEQDDEEGASQKNMRCRRRPSAMTAAVASSLISTSGPSGPRRKTRWG